MFKIVKVPREKKVKPVKEKKIKQKGDFMKKVIIFMLTFLFLFTLAILYLFYKTGSEPSTLVMSVFGFWGAEGWYLTHLKKEDAKKKKLIKNGNISQNNEKDVEV